MPFWSFLQNNINLKNVNGIKTYGANSLCDKHNSLFTLCKNNLNLENLVLVKCIRHSKASEIFKDETEFLLKETYNWFRYSSLRTEKYKGIFNLINTNEENRFSKFTKLFSTRCLSRCKAVEKILNQYVELETFFSINHLSEKCYKAV